MSPCCTAGIKICTDNPPQQKPGISDEDEEVIERQVAEMKMRLVTQLDEDAVCGSIG